MNKKEFFLTLSYLKRELSIREMLKNSAKLARQLKDINYLVACNSAINDATNAIKKYELQLEKLEREDN